MSAKEPQLPVSWLEHIAMGFIGLINNIFFLIVGSSGPRIVKKFHAAGGLGVVNWVNSFCGLFATSLNSWMSSRNISYDVRFAISASSSALGLLGCAISPAFWVACVAILFVGFSCSFGESVTFGYMAYIRKQPLVKAWGVGTGTAGFLGAGYSTLCAAFEFDYQISFYVLLPLVAIYCLAYACVLRQRKSPTDAVVEALSGASSTPTALQETPPAVECINIELLKKIAYYIVTVDLVYFAGYSISGAFLDCAEDPTLPRHEYLFPLLGMTQHVGVLIFCSSLQWFEFPYLWTMVALQFVNFAIWLSQAMLHWMPMWSLFVFIFFVGTVSGLNYVNIYHCVLTDNRLTEKEKELGTNWTALSVTFAVLIAAAFTLLSEQTYLKDFVPK